MADAEGDNAEFGARLRALGVEAWLDMRVRNRGSHHQKLVVLRHPDDPTRDVAFVGGIDLCHSRRDDVTHAGDPQSDEMADEYGDTPPWHDVQAEISGPAVHDVETVFRERWEDPAPLDGSPSSFVGSAPTQHTCRHKPDAEPAAGTVASAAPGPRRHACGAAAADLPKLAVQPGLPLRQGRGEKCGARVHESDRARPSTGLCGGSVSRGGVMSLGCSARSWTNTLTCSSSGWYPCTPTSRACWVGCRSWRVDAEGCRTYCGRLPDRVAIYGLENHAGTPVYVHAKACIIDDTWTTIGSDNFNRRSWTHDSELSAVVIDRESEYGRRLRLHLGRRAFGPRPR